MPKNLLLKKEYKSKLMNKDMVAHAMLKFGWSWDKLYRHTREIDSDLTKSSSLDILKELFMVEDPLSLFDVISQNKNSKKNHTTNKV